MEWNDHHKLEGQHAFLGASKPQWTKWDNDTLVARFNSSHAADVGTAVHALAKDLIKAHIRLTEYDMKLVDYAVYKSVPKAYPMGYNTVSIFKTLMPYVNDAIGFHMSPEVILYYSDNCFGTTDAIFYDEKKRLLRTHDLKTGVLPVHDEQLYIYNALFCLEYRKDPKDMMFSDRFYKCGEVKELNPTPKEIRKYMDLIISDDAFISKYLSGFEQEK